MQVETGDRPAPSTVNAAAVQNPRLMGAMADLSLARARAT